VTSLTGTVVAKYRRHCLVACADGQRVSCQIGRRSIRPVVGDNVCWRREDDDAGILTSLTARQTELIRIDSRGRPEVVAANITQLIVTVAPDPAPDWFLVDRYLATAGLGDLEALIVFNKIDTTTGHPPELDEYAALGYQLFFTSVRDATTLAALTAAMRGHRSVLIGQSGVGKSSLINALLGDEVQHVGALSEKSGQGRHTTTTSVLHVCPHGGELIDSPGVRDFAPYIDDVRAVQQGFVELREVAAKCRFPDCSHGAEPGCAVKTAVESGAISTRRYESFRRLYELTETLRVRRY